MNALKWVAKLAGICLAVTFFMAPANHFMNLWLRTTYPLPADKREIRYIVCSIDREAECLTVDEGMPR